MKSRLLGIAPWILPALALAACGPAAAPAPAVQTSAVLRGVAFEQELGAELPRDVDLVDERGATIAARALLRGRPVVLALVYYRCTMLCSEVASGLLRCTRAMKLAPGRDFDVVLLSIDPGEAPELAAAKRAELAAGHGRGGEDGWRCLTGPESSIRAIAGRVGFHYVKDEASGEYAHASGLVVLTPDGVVSRYLFGVDYAPRDLQLALVEASGGKVGSFVDRLLLICFHYDPASGTYGLAIVTLLRALGVATVAALGGFVVVSIRRERRQRRALARAGGS